MIVDVHTHVMWYPDHISEQFAQEALSSKLVKLEQSGGRAYAARLDLHSYDSRPEEHWTASATADRVVVFGFQARAAGICLCADHFSSDKVAPVDRAILKTNPAFYGTNVFAGPEIAP